MAGWLRTAFFFSGARFALVEDALGRRCCGDDTRFRPFPLRRVGVFWAM
jgi:hypothetical protein